MLKSTLTAAALAAVLATPAMAQQQPAPDTATTQMQPAGASEAAFMQNQDANEWRGSKLIGASVYGSNDKSIGDINDVLIANDGRVTAVVVGVGGFLGVGEKNVALPFNALTVERKDGAIDKIAVSYTKEQLKNAPTFAYYKAGQSETTGMKADENAAKPMAPATAPGGKPNGSMKK